MRHDHPLENYFRNALRQALRDRLGRVDDEDVERYLAEMLANFVHNDRIYAIRDAEGRRVESIAEMMVEGDIRLNANSFDREREVHRHIGDFVLFWSGMFPEFLRELKRPGAKDSLVDLAAQGRESYHIVSTFEHEPYGADAPTFRKLSEGFELYQRGLLLVRASLDGLGNPWADGFDA